ncbi:acetyltransferase [Deinococcus aetherius]|uniref:Acetyltransferase n=1 Tax=Deinococcus aetherius TaxID=200252 RepID=A0ABM8AHC0_9DEIO|nr:GNAT family N-acetyltransferase [Deinococcus aetherius]BDP43197.1 acetyltransferase [Deinococcus aetherius]
MDGQVIRLGDGYEARPVSLEAYRDACARLEGRIFGGGSLYAFDPPGKAPPPLGETLNWGLFHGEDLIGWHHAHQQGERTVYMADTGILREHQGRGLYTRLLPHLLEAFREAGYTLVTSHHRATNNRVIVPKLRAGFFLQGVNLYEGGVNVALTLSLDETYRGAMHVRSGLRQASGEVARRLGLDPVPREKAVGKTASVPVPALGEPAFDLDDGYTIRRVEAEVFREVYEQLEDAAYDTVTFDWGGPSPLPAPTVPTFTWLVEHGGEVVGWHSARQWDARTVYMVNTALLPGHRGRGLYTRLLPYLLGAFRAGGYTVIRSHHHATNNAVIVPKLRAGFVIAGLEVNHHGVMAVLTYTFDPVYREYLDVRSGLRRPAGEVARRLGLHLHPQEESHV